MSGVLAFAWAVAHQRNKERRAAPMGWPGTPLLVGYRDGGRSIRSDRTCLIGVCSFRPLRAPHFAPIDAADRAKHPSSRAVPQRWVEGAELLLATRPASRDPCGGRELPPSAHPSFQAS